MSGLANIIRKVEPGVALSRKWGPTRRLGDAIHGAPEKPPPPDLHYYGNTGVAPPKKGSLKGSLSSQQLLGG